MSETVRKVKNSKSLILGLAALLVFSQIPRVESNLQETRWYRDVVNITPYKEVNLTSQKFVNQGLAISGDFIKQRCVFYHLTAYLTFEDKPKYKVPMLDRDGNLMVPNVNEGNNRPPSKHAEAFGPWTIMSLGIKNIKGWEIHTDHVKCPTKPYQQNNLFASGEWKEM